MEKLTYVGAKFLLNPNWLDWGKWSFVFWSSCQNFASKSYDRDEKMKICGIFHVATQTQYIRAIGRLNPKEGGSSNVVGIICAPPHTVC